MGAGQTMTLLDTVAAKAREANAFGQVRIEDEVLRCDAKASAAPAEYRVFTEGGTLWVGLFTEDRWLSGSIEGDLVHTGDKLEELLEEEFVDLGWEHGKVTFEHFRDEQMMFTFRTPLGIEPEASNAAEAATIALLGYEICFRGLGDMEDDGED